MKKKIYFSGIAFLFLSFFYCVSVKAQTYLKTADSLFFSKDWKNAKKMYEFFLSDTSENGIAWNRLGFSNYSLGNYDKALICYWKALSFNPVAGLKASAYSRIARIHALKNEKQKALVEIDSAFNAGYTNLTELDSLKDFSSIRNDPAFAALRKKIYAIAFPCMVDTHAREFDFWVGEWDVYVTGTKQLAGHSLIQMISGGCAILENWDSPASTGKSINFIDPNTNKWKQSWSGSYANGNQEFTGGEYKDSAMHFDFETKDVQGNKITGQFIFYNQGINQVRQFNESSGDGGKTWTTNYDFTYKRKK